ncbi:MAG: aldose epimerase [Phycisphaerae bacterium]|nr:aldose epimerase [Phycisphaerae bacterium]
MPKSVPVITDDHVACGQCLTLTGIHASMSDSSMPSHSLLDLSHPASRQRLQLAPAAGFCGVSWMVEGEECLHLCQPLDQFLREEHTGGLPLLYPWANRLRSDQWQFRGTEVDLAGHARVHRDGNGLPMHGLLVRWPQWDMELTDGGCRASIDWASHQDLFAAFPFEHQLQIHWKLDGEGLEVRTSVTAGQSRVPVSFGWHPYLVLPGAVRSDLSLQLPSLMEVPLDPGCLPVQGSVGDSIEGMQSLADRSWDHCFSGLQDGMAVEMRSGERAIRMEFLEGYRWLQIYSPDEADFVCLEPMTAITAALSDQDPMPPVVDPGCTYVGRYRMTLMG